MRKVSLSKIVDGHSYNYSVSYVPGKEPEILEVIDEFAAADNNYFDWLDAQNLRLQIESDAVARPVESELKELAG